MVSNRYTLLHDERRASGSTPLEYESKGSIRTVFSRWHPSLTPCKMITGFLLCAAVLSFFTLAPDDMAAKLLPIQCHGTIPSFGGSTNIACQIERAKAEYEANVGRQSRTEEAAVSQYRLRYKRDPPAEFSEWFRFAMENNATIIDDYDVLERDLAPFRSLSAARLQRRVDTAIDAGNSDHIRITKGVLTGTGQEDLQKLIQTIASKLPDLLLPLNGADEPRIVGHPLAAETTGDVVEYGDAVKEGISATITVEQCVNASSSSSSSSSDIRTKAHSKLPVQQAWLDDSKDVCLHPELQKMHGFLQAPSYLVYSRTQFPIVGMSKLSTFGDILAPPRCYFQDFYRAYDDPDKIPFTDKLPNLYWRGSSTGILPEHDKWKTGHRQRAVAFAKSLTESLRKQRYELMKGPNWKQALTPWKVDVKISNFVHCPTEICSQEKEALGMATEFAASNESYRYKYALDLDGNGMSCRYYRLLESNSIVFKQTIHREWHDERLVPWYHFVPLSMDMQELPSLLDFFAKSKSGERYGELIATASRDYAKHSLRTVDFAVYWYRFLIEYARLFQES